MRGSISSFSLSVVAALCIAVVQAPPTASAQATISTGSVQRAIVDPKGAVVVSAKVTITNKDTGKKAEPEVTSAGNYNSGPLPPGRYLVRVAAQGFKTSSVRRRGPCPSLRVYISCTSDLHLLRFWRIVRVVF